MGKELCKYNNCPLLDLFALRDAQPQTLDEGNDLARKYTAKVGVLAHKGKLKIILNEKNFPKHSREIHPQEIQNYSGGNYDITVNCARCNRQIDAIETF